MNYVDYIANQLGCEDDEERRISLMRYLCSLYAPKTASVYLRPYSDFPPQLPATLAGVYTAASLQLKHLVMEAATNIAAGALSKDAFAMLADSCGLFYISHKTNLLLLKLILRFLTAIADATQFLSDAYEPFFMEVVQRENGTVYELLFEWLEAVALHSELPFYDEIFTAYRPENASFYFRFAARYVEMYSVDVTENCRRIFREDCLNTYNSGEFARSCADRRIELEIDEFAVFEQLSMQFMPAWRYENLMMLLFQMRYYDNSFAPVLNRLFYTNKDLSIALLEHLMPSFPFPLDFTLARDMAMYALHHCMSTRPSVRAIIGTAPNCHSLVKYIELEEGHAVAAELDL